MSRNTTEQAVELTPEQEKFCKAVALAQEKAALPLTEGEQALVAQVLAAVPGEMAQKSYGFRLDTPERLYLPGEATDPKDPVAARRAFLLREAKLSVFKTANVLGFHAPADVFGAAKRGAKAPEASEVAA